MTKAEFMQRYMLMRAGIDVGTVDEDYDMAEAAAKVLEENNYKFE